VTFLEDRIFDAARINIAQRVFARTPKQPIKKPPVAERAAMKYFAIDYE